MASFEGPQALGVPSFLVRKWSLLMMILSTMLIMIKMMMILMMTIMQNILHERRARPPRLGLHHRDIQEARNPHPYHCHHHHHHHYRHQYLHHTLIFGLNAILNLIQKHYKSNQNAMIDL